MTQSSDRLDRIEALLERSIVQHNQEMAELRAGLRETRSIADSNARSIQAWETRIEDGIAEAEEVSSSMSANTNTRMEQAIADTVQMIADLGQQQQEATQRAEQHKAEADQRFEVFLAEGRADRAEMRAAREANEAEHREWQKRFDQAMQANSTEHRAFTQNIQTLLAEIARLWQRVAG
ncbi:hypothetical protein IQ265_28205 [Nodosilinea sp. LEGE 06152]|uniref:hypothetical protein n=1 Tax=Nodosilinea sp. LEGE 06152 TaxID=2777966 RepID=UPI001883109F|nr:hypothetical protein [Nodosilinea sp. LEGE 06152]MBE9160676.1 hypothetical protein [Nodosilinea sp. LEGE 06152]